MKYLKAIWSAIMAFLGVLKQEKIEEQAEAQKIQNEIVQETQNEISEIPTKTDTEIADIAVDTGLVQSKGSGRPSKSRK